MAEPKHERILRHMLGIDRPDARAPKPYRNYYCANMGETILHEMVAAGLVELYSKRDGYEWFRCTEAGVAAGIKSHRKIRKPKAERVYAKFLDVSDALGDITFHEFLTNPAYADARRDA